MEMPITDNNSHHPSGIFWQNGVHVCCLLPLRDRWRETTEIQIPGMLQVLWEEQNRAAGNCHIPGDLCHPGWLHHCSQQHRATDQTLRAFRNILAIRQAFATLKAVLNPKDEKKKNNLYVVIQS